MDYNKTMHRDSIFSLQNPACLAGQEQVVRASSTKTTTIKG